jgi:hypothetical protein
MGNHIIKYGYVPFNPVLDRDVDAGPRRGLRGCPFLTCRRGCLRTLAACCCNAGPRSGSRRHLLERTDVVQDLVPQLGPGVDQQPCQRIVVLHDHLGVVQLRQSVPPHLLQQQPRQRGVG